MVRSQAQGDTAEVLADEVTPVETMDLVGGNVCLDFVNTGSHRASPPFKEKLGAYGDLVTWVGRVDEGVDEATAARLRRLAERDPAVAESVLVRARALREAIYRAFSAMSKGGRADAPDLELIGVEAARATAHRRLVPTAEGCMWEYAESDALERPLWPVALAAAALATSDDVSRVKECASDTCNWLFLDVSKNRSRRWCDMKDCGNRAKARRHRARSRASS
jgi:predicted RNA-binding Zn ribbon-like protein